MESDSHHKWSLLLDYDPATGSLYWRDKCLYGAAKNRRFAGKRAGSIDSHGYVVINLDGKNRKAHRVIWKIQRGDIPPGWQVDHVNGDRTDNRMENLRLVPVEGNTKNKARYSNNKSGIPGVYWIEKENRWRARIGGGSSKISLGKHSTLLDAAAARKSAELKHGYHKNHGR